MNTPQHGFKLTLTNKFEVLTDLASTDFYNDQEDCFYPDKSCVFKTDNKERNKCDGFKSLEFSKRGDSDFRQNVNFKGNSVDPKTLNRSRHFIESSEVPNKSCVFTDNYDNDTESSEKAIFKDKCSLKKNEDHPTFKTNKSVEHRHVFRPKNSNHGNKKGKITCFYTNADSLLNKRKELEVEVEINKPDIVAICEVKPKSCRYSVQPGEIALPGYELFHNLDDKGRGVLLLVKNELNPSICDTLSNNNFQEAIFVECKLHEKDTLTIGIVYRSPNSTSDNSEKLNDLIKKASNECKNLVIMGDFNYPDISWETESCKTRPDHEAALFLKTCKDSFLSQHQSEPTRYRTDQNPNLLDLVITNRNGLIDDIFTQAGLGKSDHCSLIIYLTLAKIEKSQSPRPNFSKADYESINSALGSVAWENELDKLDVNDSWKKLRDSIDEVVDKFVPKKNPSKKKGKPFMNKELLEIVREKHRTFRKSKVQKTQENIKLKNKARNKANRECKKARRNLEKTVASQSKHNPKPFWSYATSKLSTRSGVADLIKLDGTKTNSDQEKAEILNAFFQSVFTIEPEGDLPDPPEYNFTEDLNDFDITVDKVKKMLKMLHTGKAPGPDGINPMFLASTAESLATPITILFRKTLASGKIPDEWKKANVSPIFKKGKKSAPNNYRPVSLTCILCKLMEKLIREKIVDHLERNDLISNKQHGFFSGRSCVTQLIDVLDLWTKTLDEGGSIDAIYMDYQKAFDSVPHRRLIAKVKAHGISGNVLDWVQDFLTNRSQKVIINGAQSEEKEVTSGIPQGSVLGPILFVLYINDLPSNVQSEIRLFADDTKLFTRSDTKEACENLQKDLDTLQVWSEKWLLRFHPEKCHTLKLGHKKSEATYCMRKKDNDNNYTTINLEESEFEKDLGVYIDNKLNFKEHVNRSTSKANKIMGVIRRTFDYLSEEIFVQLFKSLVRPILEYGNSAWQPCNKSLCQEIENVQRRATKLLASIRDLPYPERLARLKLPSLEHRRKRGDMMEMYKYINNIYKCDNPNFETNTNKITRGHSLTIKKGHHRLNLRGNYFTVRAITTWNDLPESVVSAPSLNAFKSRLDKHWKGLSTIYDPECYNTES